jgi:hypothetical protein
VARLGGCRTTSKAQQTISNGQKRGGLTTQRPLERQSHLIGHGVSRTIAKLAVGGGIYKPPLLQFTRIFLFYFYFFFIIDDIIVIDKYEVNNLRPSFINKS